MENLKEKIQQCLKCIYLTSSDEIDGEQEALEGLIDLFHKTHNQKQVLLDSAIEVMHVLEEGGPDIVPHLMDTDNNPGRRLRDAIKEATK